MSTFLRNLHLSATYSFPPERCGYAIPLSPPSLPKHYVSRWLASGLRTIIYTSSATSCFPPPATSSFPPRTLRLCHSSIPTSPSAGEWSPHHHLHLSETSQSRMSSQQPSSATFSFPPRTLRLRHSSIPTSPPAGEWSLHHHLHLSEISQPRTSSRQTFLHNLLLPSPNVAAMPFLDPHLPSSSIAFPDRRQMFSAPLLLVVVFGTIASSSQHHVNLPRNLHLTSPIVVSWSPHHHRWTSPRAQSPGFKRCC